MRRIFFQHPFYLIDPEFKKFKNKKNETVFENVFENYNEIRYNEWVKSMGLVGRRVYDSNSASDGVNVIGEAHGECKLRARWNSRKIPGFNH